MSALPHGIRRAFRLARRRPAIDDEIDDEVAFHLEMRAAELTACGMSADAARAEARRRFGDTQQWSKAMSEIDHGHAAERRRTEWLDDLRQDVRYGMRSALRAPMFSALAVLTLALGIGANAAVFGVVKSVLLDALPYADAERLVRVHARKNDGTADRMTLSAGAATDIAERVRAFARVGVFMPLKQDMAIAGDAGPRPLAGGFASTGFFETLGVRAALGRTLNDHDLEPGAPNVLVLSHAAWQRVFGGDPGVVGRKVTLEGVPYSVAGVLPRGFVSPVGTIDAWVPMSLAPHLKDPVRARRRAWLGMVARLKPGTSAAAASRELAALSADLGRQYPDADGLFTLTALSLRDDMAGDARMPLLVVMASAGLVLLITCANLAGALLSRTLSRRKEFAIRVAIGAGRGRLVRQLLAESTLLAVVGGGLGLALAQLGLVAMRHLALPALPSYATLALDPGAVLVTSLVALATGVAFGLAPALSVGRWNPQGTLRDEARGASESRRTRTLRGALVAGQIALCASLLVGAGLLARSLWTLAAAPLGFRTAGVLTATVQLPYGRYRTTESRVQMHDRLEERLRALPGVRGAAFASSLPGSVQSREGFAIDGAPWPSGEERKFVLYASASDDYFRTMGIPLRSGRTFGPSDGPSAPGVVIVSESMARLYWPKGDAVGARIQMGPDPKAPLMTVVGIVADVTNDAALPRPEPMLYASARQDASADVLLVSTSGDPAALVKPVERALASLDPALPLYAAAPLESLLADGLASRRLPVLLMTAFGTLALLLASVGVYAMFAAMATAREREFGVRMALGSTRGAIARLVLRQGALWIGIGLVGGAFGVVTVARLLRNLLYGVPPFDPVSLGAAALALVVCAALALMVPVRRATRVDPISALR